MSAVQPMQVRFPDVVTINHGPIPLLARFFLAMDQYMRDRGVKLVVRYDMDELVRVNRSETAAGRWYELPRNLDPEINDLRPDNSLWIWGVNDAGDPVLTCAARLYDWGDTSLADHAGELLYGDRGEQHGYSVECSTAFETRGKVYYAGANWARPDYRRMGLGGMLPQLCRAFAYGSWGPDWMTCYVKRELVDQNIASAYGYTDVTYGIRYPGSPWGDLDFALARQHPTELVTMVEKSLAQITAPRPMARAA